MHLSKHLAKRIIDNCKLEDRGVHKIHGWDHYISSFMLDHTKITFKHKSGNPRASTRYNLLIEEIKKRALKINLQLDISWSGNVGKPIMIDPSRVMPLIEKYCVGQYQTLPYNNKQ